MATAKSSGKKTTIKLGTKSGFGYNQCPNCGWSKNGSKSGKSGKKSKNG